MVVLSILLGGTAALGADAMLVFPDTETQVRAFGDGIVDVHPIALENMRRAVVELPCSECPFRDVNEEGAIKWIYGISSTMTLEFTIEENNLLANGRRTFPPPSSPTTCSVRQMGNAKGSGNMPLCYNMEVIPLLAPSEYLGIKLFDIQLSVLDLVSDVFLVDAVTVTLIQDSAGDLYIAKTKVDKGALSARLPYKADHGKNKCFQEIFSDRIRGFLLAVREQLLGTVSKARHEDCHTMRKGTLDDTHTQIELENYQNQVRLKSLRTTSPVNYDNCHIDFEKTDRTSHHQYKRRLTRLVEHVHTLFFLVRFIALPAILGVMGGFAAVAVSMFVGRTLSFLWRCYRGFNTHDQTASQKDVDACERQDLITDSSEKALPKCMDRRRAGGGYQRLLKKLYFR
ncbi:uncharacterized protein N7498_011027 [Penicillium cinerascens]|uniref:DUF7728 domain-containing protein n=1 Tax=Penicillium cinerascens TaxID=70096 RepID=A0A9W9J9H6_9EURO|nr:uncharacterized protein N7498_011027 [Penicillium cinerascens]KAJ5192042.1 hypothetical protein N7498_011027 [Penicillium cinerascens]